MIIRRPGYPPILAQLEDFQKYIAPVIIFFQLGGKHTPHQPYPSGVGNLFRPAALPPLSHRLTHVVLRWVRFFYNLCLWSMPAKKRRAKIPLDGVMRSLHYRRDLIMGPVEIQILNLLPIFHINSSFNRAIRSLMFYWNMCFCKLYRRAQRHPLRFNCCLRVVVSTPRIPRSVCG